MIAVDTSVAIDFLQGTISAYTEALNDAIDNDFALISPVVITELFSFPDAPKLLKEFLEMIHPMELSEGYWQRAGKSRSKLKAKGFKAKTADALIAQSCIDSGVPLLTRDEDFAHYAKHCGLKLVSF